MELLPVPRAWRKEVTMFRVIRVWEDASSATFRFTDPKFDTRAEALAHKDKLQHRFPGYLFWVTGGNTDRVMTIYKGA